MSEKVNNDMRYSDVENLGIIYESMSVEVSVKNLFYGLKALLDDGDEFVLFEPERQSIGSDDTLDCSFIYKGVRKIYIHAYILRREEQISVSIYEISSDGKKSLLDGNQFEYDVPFEPSAGERERYEFEDEGENFNTEIGYDPVITTVRSFVDYVRMVLDRSDRGPENDEVGTPVPPNVKRNTPVMA